MNEADKLTEAAVRTMRNLVYGKPTTEANWEACREGWMRPDSVAWLIKTIASDAERASRRTNAPPTPA
jgi:hypothetical protein